MTRRPLAAPWVGPGEVMFTAMHTTTYPSLVVALLVLLAIEAPAVHFVLGALFEPSSTLAVARTVLLGSSAYLGVWLIGDLRILRESPGVVVGGDLLHVELGLRVRGRVPLAAVVAVDTADPGPSPTAIRISPQPEPNCHLLLCEPVILRGPFGIPLRGDRLDLYLDDPAGFVAVLDERLATRPAG